MWEVAIVMGFTGAGWPRIKPLWLVHLERDRRTRPTRPTGKSRICDHCGQSFPLRRCDPPKRRFWSTTCAAEARSTGKSNRMRGGRREHRVIAELLLGRHLRPEEVVHHRDHDKRNNDPANLEVMTRVEHSRRHAAERHARRRLRSKPVQLALALEAVA